MHPILEIQSTPILAIPKQKVSEEAAPPSSEQFLALVREQNQPKTEEHIEASSEETEQVSKNESSHNEDLPNLPEDIESIELEEEIETTPTPMKWETKQLASETEIAEPKDVIEFVESDGESSELRPETAMPFASNPADTPTLTENPELETDFKFQTIKEDSVSVQTTTQNTEKPVLVQSTEKENTEISEEVLIAQSLPNIPSNSEDDMEMEDLQNIFEPKPKETKQNAKSQSKELQTKLDFVENSPKESAEEKGSRTSAELLKDLKALTQESTLKPNENSKKLNLQVINNTPENKTQKMEIQPEMKVSVAEKENPLLVQWSGNKSSLERNSENIKSTKDIPKQNSDFQKNLPEIIKTAKFQILDNGRNTARIELQPKELGKMTLHITMDKDRVEGRIFVETEMARSVLSSELMNLKSELKTAGLELDSLWIDLNSGDRKEFMGSEEREAFENTATSSSDELEILENELEQESLVSKKLLDIRI